VETRIGYGREARVAGRVISSLGSRHVGDLIAKIDAAPVGRYGTGGRDSF
jgi:hypothetical protein